MKNIWNKSIPFPDFSQIETIRGAKYITVHTAREDGYHFSLGAAIIKHKGILRVSFSNSWRKENDDLTILAEKYSTDSGNTWHDNIIAKNESGLGRSHGVYFEKDGELYVFCPVAEFDRIDRYPGLKTEAYKLCGRGEYESLGVVLPGDFWPMCEPIVLNDGKLLMAGLETDQAQAAVALCGGEDITKWEMKIIPNPNQFKYWGETTVIAYPDRLIAFVRGSNGIGSILVSESRDGGNSWSGLEESDFPIANSKMYGGTLSNGLKYLAFNIKDRGYRDTLALAIGKDSFEKLYLLRDGFDAPPRFRKQNMWCYPYAFEDTETRTLYIAYSKNKEDCEMIAIPTENL
ncbi:MAG: exo-alpha-sialidase [Clostridia bacterium]|nr:exo-alpha-sialidase [Clostridia bacterium]